MRAPLSLEEFARLAHVPAEDIERYRTAGLLDPDGDGLFDHYDALRLDYVLLRIDHGHTVEEIARQVREGIVDMPMIGDLLFAKGAVPIDDAAARLGLSPDQIVALSTAVGMPITGSLDERDYESIAGVKQVLDAGMPWDALIEATRVFGDAFRRIAQTEVRIMHHYVHEPLEAAGAGEREVMKTTHEMMETMSPIVDRQLLFIHRQYLLRAIVEDVLRHQETRATGAGTPEATIAFVDLSSFTALAQVHGDEAAADILERFDELVRALVLGHAGTLVKQIGDAFMLTFDDPADAVRFAVALAEAAVREDRFPAVRVGIHAGPVIYRVGDYIGNTVNLAHRLTATAAAHEIVITEPVAIAAGRAGIAVEPVGMRLLRGTQEPLALFRVAREERPQRDPVCGMIVGDAAARLTRDGVEYAFCSEDCLRRFVDAPRTQTGATFGGSGI